ncbi:12064_t:CDS:2 [Acaulospora colombiana]|uniref:12064_t:CDS:1 n=1 Tax=Acaulospora colombiana TaxID=27376 RepID=A0ACA9K9X6_9GLOM|nr:12064_t:CDS:2 [Acaulospora colombiana]
MKLLSPLSKDYSSLLDHDKKLYDVIIQVGNEEPQTFFQAHSVVLWARSQYFRERLTNADKDSFRNIIPISVSNISAELFETLLRYIYAGTIDLDKYSLEDIILLMVEAEHLVLLEFVEYAHEYLNNHQELFFEIFSNTASHPTPDKVLLNDIDFSTDEATLLDIYLSDTAAQKINAIPNILLWNRLVEWGAIQLNLNPKILKFSEDDYYFIKQLIEPFIAFIDFKKISSADFMKRVAPIRKILDDKFYVELLETYTLSEQKPEKGYHSYEENGQSQSLFGENTSRASTSQPVFRENVSQASTNQQKFRSDASQASTNLPLVQSNFKFRKHSNASSDYANSSANGSLSNHSHRSYEKREDFQAFEEFMRPLPKPKQDNEVTRPFPRNQPSRFSRKQKNHS